MPPHGVMKGEVLRGGEDSEGFQQPDAYGHAGAPRLADLVECRVEDPVDGDRMRDNPQRASIIIPMRGGKFSLGQQAQACAEPVNTSYRGKGVVNARRKRAQRDCHQLVGRKFDILFFRPLITQ